MGIMTVGGVLGVEVNTPRARQSQNHDGGDEVVQGLPEYARIEAYRADEYPACPDSWMRSSAGVSSWFVGVKKTRGLWLDFNYCWEHSKHVAVLPSVQGVNPITGQRQEGVALEQYRERCPLHDEPFQDERFCTACQFRWSPQNYLTTTTTPNSRLWIDGFRTKEGVVRQYVFTEEESRGVAAAKLGDDRVFAIGVAFYVSRTVKPPPPPIRSLDFFGDSPFVKARDAWNMTKSYSPPTRYTVDHLYRGSRGTLCHTPSVTGDVAGADNDGSSVFLNQSAVPTAGMPVLGEPVAVRRLEVAAGARIDQRIYADDQALDFYEDEPAGRIVINYASREEVDKILKAGRRPEADEGPLAGLRVGY